jgi:predicted nucleotidyltransferase
MIYPKDFIETAEGLIFAVVAQELEQGKVLCFLRYVKEDTGWKKYDTAEANDLLKRRHPDYLHYSSVLDAHLHAVAVTRITRHHQPRQRLQHVMLSKELDAVEQDLLQLCHLFQQQGLDLIKVGVTGSLLIGVQNQNSDIDLVFYGRDAFHEARAITCELIRQGHLQELDDSDWDQSYQRRSCALSYGEYVWHERRKYNKAIINGRKFDLNFIDNETRLESINYQKCGTATLQCKVTDATRAFDYPAEFKVDHEHVDTIVSFTATYTGQALGGETVEVSGLLEQVEQGSKRIVVGSSREAHGEYIKVIQNQNA